MAQLQSRLEQRTKPVSFAASLSLTSAVTIGLGSLMGAGLYVLVGLGASAAGPGLWLAYAVCGALTFLSCAMFADFARRIPRSGGAYVYAYDQLGSLWGFFVGWLLAIAAGPEAHAAFMGHAGAWYGLFLLFGWSWTLSYHLCNGLRHLLWDTGRGFDLATVYRTGYAVIAGSLLITAAAWLVVLI